MDYRQALSPGFVLAGQYRIDRVLGVGGFGITYAAMDTGLDLQVAVKEYFPADFGRREQTLEVRPRSPDQARIFEQCRTSFLREARTLAQFRNPSIVRVLRVFEAHGTAYMVMEFERGRSLAGWAEELHRPPTQAELDRILKPLVAALQDIHAAGVIHRDIAPDNVLIRDDGTPVLIDFGAARQVLVEASRNFTGIVKQGFSPPEQYAMDAKLQGPWTDIYALGGILYQLVTGEKPVPAPERQLGIAMPPASEMARGEYRASFLTGIDRALAITPSERPQSLAQLSQFVMPEVSESRRQTDLEPISEPLPLPRQRSEPPARPPRREAPRQPDWPLPPTKRLSPDLSRHMRVVVPVVAAALVVGAMVWFGGGVATEKPSALPTSVVLDQREQAERAAAEERRKAAEKAEADRQRVEAERKAAAERAAAEERRKAAEQAEAERLRIAAERQAAETQRLLIVDIRQELNRLGCTTRGTTPGWAQDDQRALERFVDNSGGGISFPELNRDIVQTLQRFRQRVCQPQCDSGETLVDGRCERQVQPTAPSAAVQCRQINERAQLGILTDEDRDALRRLNCR